MPTNQKFNNLKKTIMTTVTQKRPIHVIASEIRKDWKKIHFGAQPYLEAMEVINSINDRYYFDTAKSIVIYFLANSTTWKGEKAKEIKKELKKLIK